jgi:hypothetical protein
MAAILIRQATQADFAFVAEHLREADAIEVREAHHSDPGNIVRNGWRWGGWKKAVIADGHPVVLYGVAPSSRANCGIPWMLATDGIFSIHRAMLVKSRHEVERMQQKYEVLMNQVHRDNAVSIKWLQWLGFEIDSTPNESNSSFFAFYRRRDSALPGNPKGSKHVRRS